MKQPLLLPRSDRSLAPYQTGAPGNFGAPGEAPPKSRDAYAAAHVVLDPLGGGLDWDATLDFRRHLWSLGLGVAEAMDTAQRGMGLDWETARALIRLSVKEAAGPVACGAGTDQLSAGSLGEVEAAYEEQCAFIEGLGGRVILMASRALAASAKGPEDYARVYGRILSQVKQPVILHWLGGMFDPALAGYWGTGDLDAAMDVCLGIMHEHRKRIDGIKISLLDPEREIAMRRRLPENVRMYTGDDFFYDELIWGDSQGFSHALLGIFDPIAPAAAAALRALDAGDRERYQAILGPTVPLSRHIFQAPTYLYKTGVVFLAYLNGHQAHFRMVGGLESARSVVHLAELFVLADRAGLLARPDLAVERMRLVLTLAGVEQP